MILETEVNLKSKVISAIKHLFVADSLSMPVHWFYRVSDIYSLFPNGIANLEDAPPYHPGSIMSLHSTDGGGRKKNDHATRPSKIVGEAILKGKEGYWDQPNIHYHHGMVAGDITLNAHCVRLLMRTISSTGGTYDKTAFLKAYIEFMTSDPPLHRDTYAESYHREFFANLDYGLPPENCGGKTHDTASIGGLVTIGPLALSLFLSGLKLPEVRKICSEHLKLTHPDEHLQHISDSYVTLLEGLLFMNKENDSAELIEVVGEASTGISMKELIQRHWSDSEVVGAKFSSACYITDSWPSVLYLVSKYLGDPKRALLVNANLGGDNVHRGAVLGTILGLVRPLEAVSFFNQLIENEALTREIEMFCKSSQSLKEA